MSTTTVKAASEVQAGDKIVRTLKPDGTPKRSVTVKQVTRQHQSGATSYSFTVEPGGDSLGWYSASYQFTIEE
jgi:hypothetical protein